MTQVRRRILRLKTPNSADEARRLRRAERQRAQLEADRQTLSRWMSKLKRAFHAIERLQARISRAQRQLTRPA